MYCPNCGEKTEERLCPKCGCDLKEININDNKVHFKNEKNKRNFFEMLSIFAISLTVILACIQVSKEKMNISVNNTSNTPSTSIKSSSVSDLTIINETGKNSSTVSKDTPTIDISKITFHIDILSPNSIGRVYANFTYDNYTGYDITYLQIKALMKDTNEKHYYTSVDTVLSGETSPIFDSFGPQSQNIDDIEFLECNITAQDKTGKKVRVEYDYKLKQYN